MKQHTTFKVIGLALVSVISITSCTSSKTNPEAEKLFSQAQSAYDTESYSRSLSLLDSLQKTFPTEVNVQRQAMKLRPQVIIKSSEQQIKEIDSKIAADTLIMTNLKSQLRWVKTPGMIEGYWIAKNCYNPNFFNTTGIEARVDEIGQFYIVTSVNPSQNLKHIAISLSSDIAQAHTPKVAYDGESNYRINGSETITFSPSQSDSIGALAAKLIESTNVQAYINFIGGKTKTIKLSSQQLNGIAVAYNYSTALIEARDLSVQREKLLKTISIAQRQQSDLNL